MLTWRGFLDHKEDLEKEPGHARIQFCCVVYVVRFLGGYLILGEEGGITGDISSDYMWCIDPLDGTTNFAHGYPSFAVSVGVLFRGKPVAADHI
ncbi:hypothetical protein ACFX2B_035796 [Malus domestica]